MLWYRTFLGSMKAQWLLTLSPRSKRFPISDPVFFFWRGGMSVWNCGLLSGATLLLVMTSHLLPKAKCNEFKLVRVSQSSSFPLTKGLSNISIPNQSLWSGGDRTLYKKVQCEKQNSTCFIRHKYMYILQLHWWREQMECTLLVMKSTAWTFLQRFADGGGGTLPAGSVSSTTTRAGGSRGIEGWRVIEGRNRWTPRVCLLNRPQNEGKYALPWSTATHDTQGRGDRSADFKTRAEGVDA